MLEALRRPLSLPQLLAGVAAAALLVALYCLAYTTLAGRPDTFAAALGWALANICPWLVAIEAVSAAANAAITCGQPSARFPASIAISHGHTFATAQASPIASVSGRPASDV